MVDKITWVEGREVIDPLMDQVGNLVGIALVVLFLVDIGLRILIPLKNGMSPRFSRAELATIGLLFVF